MGWDQPRAPTLQPINPCIHDPPILDIQHKQLVTSTLEGQKEVSAEPHIDGSGVGGPTPSVYDDQADFAGPLIDVGQADEVKRWPKPFHEA